MACISKAWFSSNIHRVKIISLTIFLYLISPFIIISILMLQVVRKFVSIYAIVFRRDLSRIISPSSSILASDDLYGIPNHNTVVWFILKGRVSIDSIQSTIYEKVLNKTDPHGQFLYPQLRQFPTHLYKFLFWKNDEDFKIENYIYLYDKAKDDNKSWSEQELIEIQRNLFRKQWTRHRSPWEIFFIPNFKPANSAYRGDMKTVMFLRFHKCLGDSFSFLQLFVMNLCDCDNERHNFPKKADFEINHQLSVQGDNKVSGLSLKRLFQSITFPFKIPFDFAQQIMEPIDTNDWKVKETNLIKRDHVNFLVNFSVQHIKDLKGILGVSFTAILLSAATSAIRQAIKKIPKTMKILIPIPEHALRENKLENSLSSCYIQLPTGIASAKERLRICEERYQTLRCSTVPATNLYLSYLVGLLPYKYFKYIKRIQPWTGTIINLPGPIEYISIDDHCIEDFVVASASDTGFVISFLSYAEYIRMSISIDHRLIPVDREDAAKDLLNNMYAELFLLGIEGMV